MPDKPLTIDPPALVHVADVQVQIAPPVEVGQTPRGMRRMIPITGGTVYGPRMRGKVLPGGADFQLLTSDGTEAHLDARYVLEMEDGARVWVENTALRVASAEHSKWLREGKPVPPEAVYFRSQPRFEATTPAWAWLHQHQFVGSGVRLPDGVLLSFYQLV